VVGDMAFWGKLPLPAVSAIFLGLNPNYFLFVDSLNCRSGSETRKAFYS